MFNFNRQKTLIAAFSLSALALSAYYAFYLPENSEIKKLEANVYCQFADSFAYCATSDKLGIQYLSQCLRRCGDIESMFSKTRTTEAIFESDQDNFSDNTCFKKCLATVFSKAFMRETSREGIAAFFMRGFQ